MLKTVEAALFAVCLSVCLTASLDSHVMTQSPKALLLELPVQKLCSEYSSRSVAQLEIRIHLNSKNATFYTLRMWNFWCAYSLEMVIKLELSFKIAICLGYIYFSLVVTVST